jgi:hypothetical protein
LRFAVRRPPAVSLRCYRPSGGDIAGGVHVGIARTRAAGYAREYRLALAVFGRDVTAGGTSLRGVRSWNALDAARGLMVEAVNEAAPSLTSDRAVEAALLRHPNTGLVECAACGAAHRPHVEVFDSNSVEPAGQIGRGFFHPITAPVHFAGRKFRDRQFRALSTVRTALGSREALLQAAQPDLLTESKNRRMEQLTRRQCRRDRDTTIDTDHAAISRPCDRFGDVRESDMPATGPIPGNAIGLHAGRHRPTPAKSDPPDFGDPHPAVPAVELFDVLRLEPDLPEPFMHTCLPPRRPTMSAAHRITHSLSEVPQRLLLDCLRPGRQPITFGAYLSQLCGLLVIPRRAAPRLPKLLLLDGEIPDKSGMPAMFQQHLLLNRCWQQSEPRHSCKLARPTDTNGPRKRAHGETGAAPRYQDPGFHPKEDPR